MTLLPRFTNFRTCSDLRWRGEHQQRRRRHLLGPVEKPRAVAERAARLGRVRVTHRDAPDFYLTAADREDRREQTLATASRLFLALIKHDPTARTLVIAMPEVFPWVRHLTSTELRAFTLELVEALSDAAELDVDVTTREVIAGWRATARIKADPAHYAQARKATSGDYGPVEVQREPEAR